MSCEKKIKTSIGGQALIEGIMMKGPKKTATVVRNPQGEMVTKVEATSAWKEKHKILGWPLLRGVVGFVESMVRGYSSLMYSAEISGEIEEEPESKFDRWLEEKFGDKLMKIAGGIGMVLGVCLAVVLFFWLPSALFGWIFGETTGLWRSVFEGVVRILIFLAYMILVSRTKEIRRVFQYHGAEHKTIFCYEAREELTVENVRKQTRFHPRCGTSFMILMLLLSIIVGFFIQTANPWLRAIIKIALLPVVMGVGYELIKICGRFDNIITRVISAPGLWMQRLTTKEPDDEMIEVAIAALREVIPEDGEDQIP